MLLSPIILTLLVIVFGLFPSILTQSIIEPATQSVSQSTGITAEFHLFHGITPAFISTIAIYIIGILLIITFSYWVRLLEAQPNQLKFNHWYDTMGRKIPSYSENMTNSYVTGFSRNNLVIIFGILILLTLVTLISVPFSINFKNVSQFRILKVALYYSYSLPHF